MIVVTAAIAGESAVAPSLAWRMRLVASAEVVEIPILIGV
jgi:hypothetical protein